MIVRLLKIRFFKIAALYLLVLYSANPFIANSDDLLKFGCIFSVILAIINKVNFDLKSAFYVSAFFLSFEIAHGFIFDFYPKTFIRLSMHLLFCFSVVSILGTHFFDNLIKVVYKLSAISLALYVLDYIPFTKEIINAIANNFIAYNVIGGDIVPTMILYTPDRTGLIPIRNAGFAWEAGGLASFIIPVLFLHFVELFRKYKRIKFDKISIVFIISIITTFSTTAYIALFITFLTLIIYKPTFGKIILLVFFIGISILAYINFPFLGQKIKQQAIVGYFDRTNNRIGSFLNDWDMFKERPLLGWSRKYENQFGFSETDVLKSDLADIHRPNGLSRLLVSYGIIFFLSYFYLTYKSFYAYFNESTKNRREANYYTYMIIFIILILGFSQLLFDKLFFKAFLFYWAIKKDR